MTYSPLLALSLSRNAPSLARDRGSARTGLSGPVVSAWGDGGSDGEVQRPFWGLIKSIP